MTEVSRKCPNCGMPLIKGEGKLDQSHQTYLPTTTWTCGGPHGGCGYKHWDRAQPGVLALPYYPENV